MNHWISTQALQLAKHAYVQRIDGGMASLHSFWWGSVAWFFSEEYYAGEQWANTEIAISNHPLNY